MRRHGCGRGYVLANACCDLGGQTMSKVIKAVYTNGVFRLLEPVVLPEGEPVQRTLPRGETEGRRQALLARFYGFGMFQHHLSHRLEEIPSEFEHACHGLGIHLSAAHHAHHTHHARGVHLPPHHRTHHAHHASTHHGLLARRLLLRAPLAPHGNLPAHGCSGPYEEQHHQRCADHHPFHRGPPFLPSGGSSPPSYVGPYPCRCWPPA